MTQQDDYARAEELLAYLDGFPADAARTPEMEAAEDELDAITMRTIFRRRSDTSHQ